MFECPDININECLDQNIKEEEKFKVVVVGDSGVGKTNLIKRFISNEFSLDSKATVGVEFISKNYNINNKIIKIEIWDTAGQERYKSITSAYYKGAKGAMIVYDVTNQTSFNNIDKWYFEIKEKASKNINLMLIGNKTDLNKVICREDAINKAKSLNIPVMETSANNSSNVKEAFYDLIKEMYKSVLKLKEKFEQKENRKEEGIKINIEENNIKKKKKCC
jgi:Ras-related protein Rab-11A